MALTLYFAYGSNLSDSRMSYRCPAARPYAKAELKGYRLTFCENSSGHGVANIIKSSRGKVQGFLYIVTPKCIASLDMYEGAPTVYERIHCGVRMGREEVECFTYAMVGRPRCALPSEKYFDIVFKGYTDKGLDRERLTDTIMDLKPAKPRKKLKRKPKGEEFPLQGLS